jgi:hypothetical protein
MEYNFSVLSRIWPVRILETLVFLGAFLVIILGASVALQGLASVFGLSSFEAERVLVDNELVLQILALSVAGIALMVARHRLRGESWRALGAELWTAIPRGRREEAWNMTLSSALRAFLAVSVIVAVSVFLGFGQIEFGVWQSWDAVFRLFAALPDVALLFVWLFLLDAVRNMLWRGLVGQGPQRGSLQNRLLIVAFEACVLFRFFNGSPHLVDQLFTALVCALLSSAFLLWLEFARASRLGWREDVKRLAFQAGLWGTIFHVYGYPRAGNRASSLLHVFAGGSSEPLGSLGTNGVIGQALFVLLLVVCVNALLQRALRLTRH